MREAWLWAGWALWPQRTGVRSGREQKGAAPSRPCGPRGSGSRAGRMCGRNEISKIIMALAGAVLGTSVGEMANAASALAEEHACRGTLGAVTLDNVRVPQGATCTLKGTRVKGTRKVERNA